MVRRILGPALTSQPSDAKPASTHTHCENRAIEDAEFAAEFDMLAAIRRYQPIKSRRLVDFDSLPCS